MNGVFGAADDIRRTAAAYYPGPGPAVCEPVPGHRPRRRRHAPVGEPAPGRAGRPLRAFLAGDEDAGRRVVDEYLDLPTTHLDTGIRSDGLPHALRGWHGDPVGAEIVARFNAGAAAVIRPVAPTTAHDRALDRTRSTLDKALPLLGLGEG
ncbi:hypothetical protein [Saccharothrix sp.]|uniref:hypothetical protein n=1 Tax=Saccharothrix sp. TaxID=1873460 RepID=UPI0028125DE4|nr:hypothetical protein [Saccharothrix sp.]